MYIHHVLSIVPIFVTVQKRPDDTFVDTIHADVNNAIILNINAMIIATPATRRNVSIYALSKMLLFAVKPTCPKIYQNKDAVPIIVG